MNVVLILNNSNVLIIVIVFMYYLNLFAARNGRHIFIKFYGITCDNVARNSSRVKYFIVSTVNVWHLFC
jgi:hypothetical protein